jgi:hypothetical protein
MAISMILSGFGRLKTKPNKAKQSQFMMVQRSAFRVQRLKQKGAI